MVNDVSQNFSSSKHTCVLLLWPITVLLSLLAIENEKVTVTIDFSTVTKNFSQRKYRKMYKCYLNYVWLVGNKKLHS